jgi:HEPN domain-containing protein
MPPNEPDILRKVRQWLQYGDEDLVLAKHGLTLSSAVPYRLIAYHAQQCVEKHLKGYLVAHAIDFPYTHNLSRLVELAQTCRKWPALILEAEELTPYAITTRYPGEDEPVSADEAVKAIAVAEKVRHLIRHALLEEGIDPD